MGRAPALIAFPTPWSCIRQISRLTAHFDCRAISPADQTALRFNTGVPSNAVFCRASPVAIQSFHLIWYAPTDPENSMVDSSINPPSAKKPPEKRLDSWKEIATYLNRDVTTVQRWEKCEGMPVHRHLHDKRGSVYAFPAELDGWARSRQFLLVAEGRSRQNSGITADTHAPPPANAPGNTLWRWIVPLLVFASVVATCVSFWMQRTDRFWGNPITGARFEAVTDWGGLEQAAAISRDGQFIAFLSDREGQMDVWVTQVGSGQFHNLTHGSAPELVNPSVRTLGFSPDGSLVTYWVRKPGISQGADIGIWAVPILGGEPRPYLDGAAECDWSSDGQMLAYHTSGPGDPLFVSAGKQPAGGPIFVAPDGLHAHFPTWSPDKKFIYFVQGSLPDKLDVWRIPASGGAPERITSYNSQVSYPILLNRRTLVYLATDPDGSGPWLYMMDVERRIPHRLSGGLDRYTSLAASANGRRLAVTLSVPRTSLWNLHIDPSRETASAPAPITLTTSSGYRPRLGPDFLLYLSAGATSESIWKLVNGVTTELWRGEGAEIIGGPAISADGRAIAFSVRQNGRLSLYVMASDGANPRILTDSLDLQGDPAWEPDERALITAVVDHGAPRLFRVQLNGSPPVPFVSQQSSDPAWAPDGSLALYSGPDIGTTFSVKAVKPDGSALAIPPLTLTRGARHLTFLPGSRTLVVLRGELQHKNLWLVSLDTGNELQLTNLPADFDARGFDVSPDGHEAVLERIQDRSEVVLVTLARR